MQSFLSFQATWGLYASITLIIDLMEPLTGEKGRVVQKNFPLPSPQKNEALGIACFLQFFVNEVPSRKCSHFLHLFDFLLLLLSFIHENKICSLQKAQICGEAIYVCVKKLKNWHIYIKLCLIFLFDFSNFAFSFSK